MGINNATVPPVIRNGEHINVIMGATRSGLKLTTTAIALENGGLRQKIEVENQQTHHRIGSQIVGKITETQGLFIVIQTKSR